MKKNQKLGPFWIGPFQVESKHSPVTYRLKLPPGSRMHPVVYVGWLRPYYASDALPMHLIAKRTLQNILTSSNSKFVGRFWKRKWVKSKHTPDHDTVLSGGNVTPYTGITCYILHLCDQSFLCSLLQICFRCKTSTLFTSPVNFSWIPLFQWSYSESANVGSWYLVRTSSIKCRVEAYLD